MSEQADLDELARRYLDLWQDQMTALAGDEQFAESLQRLMTAMGLASPAASEFLRAWPAMMAGLQGAPQMEWAADGHSQDGGGRAPTRSGEKRAAGTATPAAASSGGGSSLDELARRLADLEKRVAALEAGAPPRRSRAASKSRKGRS